MFKKHLEIVFITRLKYSEICFWLCYSCAQTFYAYQNKFVIAAESNPRAIPLAVDRWRQARGRRGSMAASRVWLVDASGRSSRRQCLAVHRSVWCVSRSCCSGRFFLVVCSYFPSDVSRCSSQDSCGQSGRRERGSPTLR